MEHNPYCRRFAFFAACLLPVIAVHALSAYWGISPVFRWSYGEQLWDPDSYSRLAQVVQLYQSGDWYGTVFSGANVPYGVEMQWSRLVDILLLGGAGLLVVFGKSMASAIHVSGIWLGPVLHLLTIGILAYWARPLLGTRGALLLIVLFLLQRAVTFDFLAGQADHHALLAMLATLAFAALLRGAGGAEYAPNWISTAAFLLGLGVWTSPESLLLVAVCAASLGLFWVIAGTEQLGALRRFVWGFLAALLLGLLVDQPPLRWFVAHTDRLSILHVALALAMVAAVEVLVLLQRRELLTSRLRRLAIGVLVACAALLTVRMVFHQVFLHPYASVDPFILQVIYGAIQVEQPLRPTTPVATFFFLLDVGLPLSGLAMIPLLYSQGTPAMRQRAVAYALAVPLFALMTWHGARWTAWLELTSVFPLVDGCLLLRARAGWLWQVGRRLGASALSAAIVMALAWPWMALDAYETRLADPWALLRNTGNSCRLDLASQSLQDALSRYRSPRIMAPVFSGPEMFYRTGVPVVGTPMHRNAAGIRDTFAFFLDDSSNWAHAQLIAQNRALTHVVFCRDIDNTLSKGMFRRQGTLLGRLYMRTPPDWLRRVQLPGEAGRQIEFYEILRD